MKGKSLKDSPLIVPTFSIGCKYFQLGYVCVHSKYAKFPQNCETHLQTAWQNFKLEKEKDIDVLKVLEVKPGISLIDMVECIFEYKIN